ncbi:hypothetical protein MUCCIDRAFT_189249 [Mucor lusitanicus CBS 277.49]|uniref:Uncharacterized protein n=1 Tax=Mucor lusitanicus CBS 277.49 TaxID=747725 RepID=A0A168MPT9_MUCCL|nr:hypothetical protein MUCCIDRAFT_189249 [Mucor lusitanicus CBS 277.49]
MDKSEFPKLDESVATPSVEKSALGSSWAEVAQPHNDTTSDASAAAAPEKNASLEPKQETTSEVDHRPNAWEATKDKATFADIAGHEKKQEEEFPTPQEALKTVDTESLPASGGVGDLLNSNSTETHVEDTTQPPNPDRSFAAVTSNKDFPTPEHDASAPQDPEQPPLSDLPDVKDMLKKPSVHVPPVPPAQSFAKIAAKPIPPEDRPLSERAQHILNNQPKEEPLAMTEENFPTLEQSNLMSEENASVEDKAVYSEISRFHQLNEEEQVKENKETVYLETAKREERKNLQVEHGNNEQLIKEEELKEVEPTKEQKEQEEEDKQTYEKSREIVTGEHGQDEDALAARLGTFDSSQTGKITIFHTMFALYRLGYSWLSIIPGALLMHIRLSPLTSPYGFPFIYRSPFDLILLPIYTNNLTSALSYKTPMLHQPKEEVTKMVKTYGHKDGLGYWDGIRAMRSLEKDSLRWWQLGLWAVHRIQWTLAYTMLHEPQTNVVTVPTLVSLASQD